jgi:cation transport regulator
MPYPSRDALPDSVRNHLPPHAQDIFVGAFNSAHDEYGDEVRAFRVAWAAVKRKYRKQGDQWVSKVPARA